MKFNIGDKVLVLKPKNTKEEPYWLDIMDVYNGCFYTISDYRYHRTLKEKVYYLGEDIDFVFNKRWLTKL